MNIPVNFPTAKMLKEIGFDKVCYKAFCFKIHQPSNIYEDNIKAIENAEGFYDSHYEKYYRPTIAEVVMWLYEKHGIWIDVSITIQKKYCYQCLDITGKKDPTKNNYPSRICKPGRYFKSPTEAYEAAIEYVLTKDF